MSLFHYGPTSNKIIILENIFSGLFLLIITSKRKDKGFFRTSIVTLEKHVYKTPVFETICLIKLRIQKDDREKWGPPEFYLDDDSLPGISSLCIRILVQNVFQEATTQFRFLYDGRNDVDEVLVQSCPRTACDISSRLP